MSTNKIFLALSAATLLVSACKSDYFINHNGNMPSEEKIAEVRPGLTKDDVLRLLGAPSSVVSLDNGVWIYMSCDVKKMAFFEPEETQRDILKIKFDNQGRVVSTERLNKGNGTNIAINEDKTETLGQDPGLLQKTFGTFGTYSPFMTGANSNKL